MDSRRIWKLPEFEDEFDMVRARLMRLALLAFFTAVSLLMSCRSPKDAGVCLLFQDQIVEIVHFPSSALTVHGTLVIRQMGGR